MKKVLLISFILVLGLALNVWADLIPVAPSDWNGTRSTPTGSGVIAYDGWANESGGFKISWAITFTSGAEYPWSYSYSLTDLNGEPLTDAYPSHLLLEVSPDFILDIDTDISDVQGPMTWTDQQGNPYMPGSLWGIKLNEGLTTYSFLSKVGPIWGDFYSKDGKHDGIIAVAYNSNFGNDPDSLTRDFTGWVPVPDTEGAPPPVSEPGTLMLIATGLLGLGLFGRGKFKK
jgi:PEP-CTERM motif